MASLDVGVLPKGYYVGRIVQVQLFVRNKGRSGPSFAGEVARNFFPLATLINNAELAQKPVQIVLIGKADDPALIALRRAVYAVFLPRRVVQSIAADAALPANHPAARCYLSRRPGGRLLAGSGFAAAPPLRRG